MFAERSEDTIHYDSNLLSYLGTKLWETDSRDIKKSETVKAFKFAIYY